MLVLFRITQVTKSASWPQSTDTPSLYQLWSTAPKEAKLLLIFLKSHIQQHSIPKSIKTDRYSGFKYKLVQAFCNKKNLTLFCQLWYHRGCGLVERSVQTIKRRLGAAKLSLDFPTFKILFQQITEVIRVTKNSIAGFSPFELQFGRSPNTELSIAVRNFPQNTY